MNENGSKRREWVKTAAIIFLSVMLVLTFFSQTILNYSLPEVATQYVQSGAITAKIRGTGVVESGDPYEVKVTDATVSRKVTSVEVRVGDVVQKGDVLMYLEAGDNEDLKTAKEELEKAKNDYDLALLKEEITSSNIYAANKDVSAETYRRQITSAQTAVKNAESEWEAAKAAVIPHQNNVDTAQKNIDAYTLQIAHDSNQDVINRSQKNVEDTKAAWEAAERNLTAAKKELDQVTVSGGDASAAQSKVTIAQYERDEAYKKYDEAFKSENNRAAAVQNLSAGLADWTLQKALYEKDMAAAEALVTEKENALKEAQAKVTELVGNIDKVVGLEQLLDAIAKAQAKVDELSAKASDTAIRADIAGTVTAINVTSGNTTSATTPVAVLQPEGKGYTLSFSVTNEQAKRLSVGDRADLVNAWRYDDVEATLASIKPDKSNPGQQKMLTFDITGEIVAGQTLNLSVGQKSANFDLIVPNSAIREDSNGKFVLIVESRPSPLGNRYVATRVDVEVLASDDTQSAISAALYGYEYVITTSTKPVEAGKQVRLADN